MNLREKQSKIDDAISCVEDARSSILPLSYDNEGMAEAQSTLLEARDALQEWYDALADPDKRVFGNEKRYIMRRLQKVKKFLGEQPEDYEAEECIDSAIKALL